MTGDTKRKPSNDQSGGSTDGRALFVDCDVVFLRDPVEVLQYAETAPTAGIESGPPDTTAAPAQGEPQYCEHAWKYGGRHAGCVVNCGLPRRPPTAPPAQGELPIIGALRAENERQAREIRTLRNMAVTEAERAERAEAEIEALRAALRQIYFLDHNEREWESVQEVKLFAERAAIDAAMGVS